MSLLSRNPFVIRSLISTDLGLCSAKNGFAQSQSLRNQVIDFHPLPCEALVYADSERHLRASPGDTPPVPHCEKIRTIDISLNDNELTVASIDFLRFNNDNDLRDRAKNRRDARKIDAIHCHQTIITSSSSLMVPRPLTSTFPLHLLHMK